MCVLVIQKDISYIVVPPDQTLRKLEYLVLSLLTDLKMLPFIVC